MKRLLLALFLVSLLVSSAGAKVLLITSNAANVDNTQTYLIHIIDRMQKTLGYDYDQVLATYVKTNADGDTIDSPWIMANSGEYTEAICVPLSMLSSSSYHSEALLAAQGWPELSMWINRNSVKAFPIRLILPVPTTVVQSGCWATEYTGLIAQMPIETVDEQPITDLDGDSIYVKCHAAGTYNYRARIADSLDWVEAMIWQDKAVAASTGTIPQKYCYIWRTVGTGNHEVVYILNAHFSWIQPYFAAVIAMGEKVTPIEVPILADNYGYVAASYATGGIGFGTSVDTVSFAYNLRRITDYVVAQGIKVDFLVSTYQMNLQNCAGQAGQTDILALTDLVASYPNNLRMTHKTDYSWQTAYKYDWLGYANAGSYLQMTRRINNSMDSTEAHFDVSSTRLFGANDGKYAGVSTYTKVDSVLNALVDCGVSSIYVSSNAHSGNMQPVSAAYGVVAAGRTWIGESHKELKMYPIVTSVSTLSSIANTANNDSARIYYLAPVATYSAARANGAGVALKKVMGQYALYNTTPYSYSSISQVRKASRVSNYSPGLLLETGLITGGSKLKYLGATSGVGVHASVDSTRSLFFDELKEINNQVKMANNIVTRYGTTGQPVFIWAWLDEVKLDRQLGMAFVNSHVKKRR